jgi:hypothetical protein
MASAAQMIANKANAQASTGPRTEAGKTTARFNSLRHGLTSSQLVLPHENQEEYDGHRAATIEALDPSGEHEHALAERVVQTYWRMQRFYRIENAFLAQRMNAVSEANPELTDGDDALATLFTDPAEMSRTRLMLRYLTAAERAYNKAVADLEKARKERHNREQEEAMLEAMEERATAAAENTSAGIGLVSHARPVALSLPLPTPENTAPGGVCDPAFHLARLNQI